MRNRSIAAACVAALSAVTLWALPLRAAEPTVSGLWQIVEDGKVQGWALFVDRNGVFEGALAKLFPDPANPQTSEVCSKCKDDRKDQPVLGISFIRDMKREGLAYEGGNILDPKTGSVWKAKMTLSPDGQTLTLRGYLGFSLLGQDRTWTRLPDSNMAQLDPAVTAKYLPKQGGAQRIARPKAAGTAVPATAPARSPIATPAAVPR